jgi:hypothetical protein
MRSITILLIILINGIDFLYGQQSFEKDLLLLEQKIYSSQSDSDRNAYCFQKFDLYILNKNYSPDALKEAKRIDYELFKDSISRYRFLWNSAMIAQLNEEKYLASYYLNKYQVVSGDSSIQVYLLASVINNGFDSVAVSEAVYKLAAYDKKFESLRCMNRIYEYQIKNKRLYPLASAIIPGLGSMLNGNVGKGLSSLAINSAAAYGVYALVQNNLYLNAIFWGTGVGLKFYAGNIKLTAKLVEEKELFKKNTLAVDCKCVLNKLSSNYPLEFK